MEPTTTTTPMEQNPPIDAPVAQALDVLFDAVGRAYDDAAILPGTNTIDGLGSEREDLEAVFGLEPAIRERLVRIEHWPEASDAARQRLEERFEEVQALSDDERRLVADVLVGTFLAAADLVEPDPDHERLEQAKAIDDRLPLPSRLFGKPLSLLTCSWYLGLHVKDD